MIKFPINLGDGGLYLDGLFFSNIESANDLIKIPLKAQIRYDDATFNSTTCQNDLRPVTKYARHDLAIAINDCTLNELIAGLYYADLLKLNITAP